MAPEEVDLTSATPPKKMKQARLPFAPRPTNKPTRAPSPAQALESKEVTRKRKLSGGQDADENLTPSKAARTEEKPTEEVKTAESSIKSKLAAFVHKEESETRKVSEEKTGEKKDKRNIKPKKEKSKAAQDDDAKEETTGDEKKEKDGGKFHGLLKMPFKKTKKKEKKESEDPEDDFDLVLESSVDESAMTEESSMTSMTSMTDEWAKFHENQDTDQSMEDLESGAKKVKKTKLEKQQEKEDKLKKKQEEKALKEEEKAKAKADKEKQKQLQKEEKDKKEKMKEEKIKTKPAEKTEEKQIVKVNSITKFLSRGKDESKKPAKTEPEKKEEANSAKCVNAAPETSTPIRPTPTADMESSASTPVTIKNPFTGTPYTPDPHRAQKVNIAKLKTKVTELDIEMEEAVNKKDFLKAHQIKEKKEKLEESIKKMEVDPSFSKEADSLLDVVKKTKAEAAPVPPKTPQTPRNISVVSTPGSSKKPSANPSKKEALEKERQAKKEALEKERQAKKEALELEKQAKKEAKEKEKIEKEQQRELEKQAKNEERLEKEKLKKVEKEKAEAEKSKLKAEKEEERIRKKAEKEAEIKQKEEEKRQQEVADKEKAKKEANVFMSFFKKEDPTEKKENVNAKPSEEISAGNLTVFRVKENMRLAPLVRADTLRARTNIDSLDMPCGPAGLYLAQLKADYTPGKQGRTWPYEKSVEEEADDVEILEDEEEESDPEDDLDETNINIIMRKGDKSVKFRAKLLKFHENQRPAYWGTWTKTSQFISGRRPFGRDEETFDYDYESDDDWEEEEEGESLSDDEKDKEEDEENEDYEVDNEFFVPHGYLSDEEEDKEEDEVLDPETAKEKQKLAARAFEKEHKKKTAELKPRLWGCYFPDGADIKDAATLQMAKILNGYAAVIIGNNNLVDTSLTKKAASPSLNKEEALASAKTGAGSKGAKVKLFPEEALPDLIRLVHGNNNSKMFLAKEFLAFWSKKTEGETKVEEEGSGTPSGKVGLVSKKKVVDKIQEVAEYKKPGEGGSKCWLVKEEILTVHGVTGAQAWDYTLDQPNKNSHTEETTGSRPESPACRTPGTPTAPANLITKFARVLTDQEKEEAKAKQEKEAQLAKARKEEQAARLAVMKADLAAKQVGSPQGCPAAAKVSAASSPLQMFTKTLTEMQKKGQLSSDPSKPPPPAKKRVALTTLLPGAKTNPIVAIAGGPKVGPPSKAPVRASPIAVKRKPGPGGVQASPIAVKRKPGSSGTTATPLSFKGIIPDSVTLSRVKTSPEEQVECVTIDD